MANRPRRQLQSENCKLQNGNCKMNTEVKKMEKLQTQSLDCGILYREFTIPGTVNPDTKILDLTFSSEEPAERFFGNEILDHSPESVDLSRAEAKKMPLLWNHNRDEQIGIVESAVVGSDRKGRATVRFGNSEQAKEILADVSDGIKTGVSVGYRIYEMILEKHSEDEGDTYRAIKWQPVEISIASIPLDYSVGTDRSKDGELNEVKIINRSFQVMKDEVKNQEKVEVKTQAPPPEVDTAEIERDTREKEIRRIQEIEAIGEKFNLKAEALKAVRTGDSVDEFRQQVLSTMEEKKHIDTKAAELDIPDKEKKKYSFSKLLISLVTNDPTRAPFEHEVSREMEKKLNKKPQGIFVPHEVLIGDAYKQRTLTAASGAANLVGTEHKAESFIEMLRNRIVVQQLGTLTLTGLTEDLSIPKQSGAGTGNWLATETTSVTAADQTFTAVTLSPKNAAADTQISRQAILQANPSIEALVMSDLIAVLARLIDLGAINGSGASGQPTGILNTSGIGSVTGTSFDWAAAVEFETDVAAANADLGSMYYLTNASVRGILKTRAKDAGSGLFLMEKGEMNGYQVPISNQVPASTMIFGAFNQLIMGFWGVLDLMVNPYLYAATRYVAIHSTQTVDVAVRHAAAFTASSDIS
jgi:HK97 family phage major capsid protein